MYYVYILRDRTDGRLYKGSTSDVRRRMKEHQKRTTATTAHGSYALVWFCAFPTKKHAICFEHYLKSGSGIAFTRKHLVAL
ncbi:MAG: GIY-YIG nuclease family protein [Patescibacteria group bacterium]